MKLILSGMLIEEGLEGMEVDFVEGKDTAAVTAAAMVVQIKERANGKLSVQKQKKKELKADRKIGMVFLIKG